MKPIGRLLRALFFRHRSLTIVSVVFVVALASAYATGFWLLFRLAYVILIGVPVAFIWSRFNLAGIQIEVERPAGPLQEGGRFDEFLTVINQSWATKLWLEVEDLSDLPGHRVRRVIAVPPRGRRTWRARGTCNRRGLYTFGPVQVTSGDPFGLFRVSRRFGERQPVLVYPRALDLPRFYVPPANLPGDTRFRRRTHTITPNAAGVRPYAEGDSFSRIHWLSTARTGQIMVKLFELDPASDIWIVLDLDRRSHYGEGDDGTEEQSVRIAASVARFFLNANRAVGFVAYGRDLHDEPPERGMRQYLKILEHLALARAQGEHRLGDLLTSQAGRFGRQTTVIVITPSTEEAWIAGVQTIAQRGTKVAVVLLEPSTFGADRSSLLVYGALAASDIFTYLVKRSDNLAAALEERTTAAGTRD